MLRWLLLLIFLPAMLLTGCSKKHYDSADYYYAEEAEYDGRGDYGAAVMTESVAMERKRSSRPSGSAAPPSPAMMDSDDVAYDKPSEPDMGEGSGGQPAQPSAAADRMVFYNGYAQIRVARVDEGIDAVRTATEEAGGRVETIGQGYVVIRVPVAAFQEVFDQLLGLGDVLDKQITADDVTDSFTAVSLRLTTAKATRARLQELLAKAETEEEKLQLLKEIQRLTDVIDLAETQARTLKQLASMSRITIQLVGRDALAWQGPEDEALEMAWIRRLSPFHSEVDVASRQVKLPVPEGMVALDLKRRFVAESADGARIWTHKMLNEPAGDAGFWLDSIEARLAADFGSAERVKLGGLDALRLVDRSEEPYTWVIAVRTEGKRLHLVQVFYPGPEQEARHEAAVSAVLAGGEA